jgi:ligand-binding SRPBCC domain-containing protein
MAIYTLESTQKIPASMEEVWDFMSSPKNLKEITPSYMGFEITSKTRGEKMYPGMIISYKVSPVLGIKMTWVTEITHVDALKYFVDEQRVGPYRIWHHEHHIKAIDGGVLMEDIITYEPPFGFLGAIANSLFIKNQLKEIFDYRFEAVVKKFGVFSDKV